MCKYGCRDGEGKGILYDFTSYISEYSRNPNVPQIQEHYGVWHSKKGDHEICYRHVRQQKVGCLPQVPLLENDINHHQVANKRYDKDDDVRERHSSLQFQRKEIGLVLNASIRTL